MLLLLKRGMQISAPLLICQEAEAEGAEGFVNLLYYVIYNVYICC